MSCITTNDISQMNLLPPTHTQVITTGAASTCKKDKTHSKDGMHRKPTRAAAASHPNYAAVTQRLN